MPVASVVLRQVRQLGPWLVSFGFLMLICIALRSTFKRHHLGPFALWIEPSKYLSMKFTDGEICMFKISGCLSLSGLLVIAVASIDPT